MSFQNPRGLWLLLGIPVLILIWLIRQQHENRRVSSSYIWRLSDRFLKRRLPLSRFRRWLVFLLQLLLVAGGAFLAARPVLDHGAQVDYLIILDASASMQTKTEGGDTRYETAVGMVRALSKEVSDGHTMSVILAGEQAEYLLADASSRQEVLSALDASSCGWGGCALSGAMTLAQLFLYEHPGAEVILYTDQTVEEAEEITVVRIGGEEWNAALTRFSVQQDGEGGADLTAALTSHGQDAQIAVGLYIDGRLAEVVNYDCRADTPAQVRFHVDDLKAVASFALAIDPGDALAEDNRIVYFPENERPCDTLLVTQTPFYLETALDALGRGEVRLAAVQTEVLPSGYDLCVFDGFVPDTLPEAGAVFLVNPPAMPDGLTLRGVSEEPVSLTASAAGSVFLDKLLSNMTLGETVVAKHSAVDATDDWTTVCSAAGDPVLLARNLENGCALVVLLFDLHDANLPLQTDFLHLLRNVMNLATPSLLERRILTVGETQTVTLLPNAAPVVITAPDGTVTEIGEAGDTKLAVSLPGAYPLVTEDEEAGFFAVIPEEESAPAQTASLTLIREESDSKTAPEEATEGIWRIAALILLAILLTEWGIYVYEQH